MVRQLTTRAQVSGYRFLLQRAEHALVRRDARMLHDPMRAQRQSITVGIVLAVLVTAGSGVYGLIRPVGSVADSPIVLNRADGGLYVVVDKTAHPVLNLASARLIAQSAAAPKTVSPAALRDLPRGPTLGIVGAPNALGSGAATSWSVCDAAERAGGSPRTAVVIGPAGADGLRGDPAAGLLAAVDGDHHLVYRLGEGLSARTVRARVDTRSAAIRRALRLDGAAPRSLSAGMFDALEEVPPLRVPAIPGAGRRGVLGLPVGTVFAVTGVDGGAEHFVAFADGVQPVPATVAELLRAADDSAGTKVVSVPPGKVAAVPVVRRLAVDHFPRRVPRLLVAADAPVVCQRWVREPGAPAATTSLRAGHAVPGPAAVVPVGADGAGPRVDEIRVAPGSTHDVRLTGMDPQSTRRTGRVVIGDTGMRHGVPDDATAQVLGLGEPGLAPWPVVRLLPAGPELSRAQAMVARGGFDQ
ncbi:MAG: type VII secretion protein EccB [Gordonia sp. (in: high G+C Gram-positive bacteria)]|uniref:type VII secretion protein EccB n=1 Tax=Gordonia sp. (in: high G+C Gram-positive bacteria) TaxID=84139 RepID=UPI0039E30062